MAQVRKRLASVYGSLGQPEQAKTACHSAIAILERLLVSDPGNADLRHRLAGCYLTLGQMYRDTGHHDQILEAYRNGLEIQEPLVAASPNDPAYRLRLAMLHGGLGSSLMGMQGDLRTSSYHASEARKLVRRLAKEVPKCAEYQSLLGDDLLLLAKVEANQGMLQKARERLEESVRHHQAALLSEPRSVTYRSRLLGPLHALPPILRKMDELGMAEQVCRQAIPIAESLVADFPHVPGHKMTLSDFFGELSITLAEMAKYDRALEAWNQCVSLREAVVSDFPDVPSWRHDLLAATATRADLQSSLGYSAEAERSYRRALPLIEECISDSPGNPIYGYHLCGICCGLARLRLEAGDLQEAHDLTEKGLCQFDVASRMEQSPGCIFPSSSLEMHQLAVEALMRLGRSAEAEKRYAELVSFADQMLSEFPRVAVVHDDYAWFLATCAGSEFRNAAGALQHVHTAVELEPEMDRYRTTLGVAE